MKCLAVCRAQEAAAAKMRAAVAAAASEVSDAERAAHAAAEEAHRVATLQAAVDIKAWDEARAAQQVLLPTGLAHSRHIISSILANPIPLHQSTPRGPEVRTQMLNTLTSLKLNDARPGRQLRETLQRM